MRTQKRFTPSVLERFLRQGRGTGTYKEYVSWHRVGRGDPASIGRSHLMMWRERQRELLSDGEMSGVLFSTMLSNVEDLAEQFRLALEDGPFELGNYDVRYCGRTAPGTLAIAKQLGIKHPMVHGEGRSVYWIMTTDQLLVLRLESGELGLLAVAYKPTGDLTKRKRQLLTIEKAYWDARGVPWLLITPDVFEESVGVTLWRVVPWGLGSPVSEAEIEVVVEATKRSLGHSWNYTNDCIAWQVGSKELAQRAFWQAVWSGALTMDLRTGWRPHLPIRLLDPKSFSDLNPIASRRSAWN